ncbi:MAG: PIG-L family deacetylase [Actinomycetota bacterium]|nr:PIG-L family deacetylase [Actinomycetota bacterium]MDA8280899.1 PIG-L family deacetylase [Actinomycetota bacterium]
MTDIPEDHRSDPSLAAAGLGPTDATTSREAFTLPVGQLPVVGPPSTDLPVPAVAVAIGAHPDDVDFGCGGTLAKWAAAGCRTHHVVLTDGSKGTWDATTDQAGLVAARQQEQRRAAELLGSQSVVFMGLVDGELRPGADEQRLLCQIIRQLRPDVVIGHDPWRRYRLHPDHRHAGWLTVDAVVAARDPTFFPELPEPPHRPQRLLLFEPDDVNHVEDIRLTVERKVEAILAHRSQHRTTMGFDGSDAEDLAGRHVLHTAVVRQASEHGAVAGLSAGEAFHRIDGI